MVGAPNEVSTRKPHLYFGGYEYRFDRTSKDGDVQFFRCIHKGCKGRAHCYADGKTIKVIKNHAHKPNQRLIQSRSVHNRGVNSAANSERRIASRLTKGISDSYVRLEENNKRIIDVSVLRESE
ncbi:hypothetical protein Tcan_15288 [Toxocara canis]|uniref:FLYWCH-type domain-containing protein n=1 Tax=Toxocara canis TaxID=6265 RepID=A0A0B2VM62_TOXCA|nr:hypothetical protein Tcan_15288 [Toxocara canis]